MSGRLKIVLVVMWLAMVAPLVLFGFGSDNDAWRVARAADETWDTKEYVMSRSVGFPVYELLVTPLVHFGGWYLSNLLSLVFGMGLVAALLYLAKQDELEYPTLVFVSVAFLPVIVTNASTTMDYVPALTILVWSYIALRERQWLVAAALIGFACGFRPTSGLFMIPAVVYSLKEGQSRRRVVSMVLLAALVGVGSYSPVLFAYGLRGPFPKVRLDMTTHLLIGGYNLLRLFGIIQSIVVGFVLIRLLRRARNEARSYLGSPHFAFHATVIAVWLVLFVVMPHEPEYLLPAVPSLILIIDKVATRGSFALIAALLVSYHVIQLDALAGESGQREVALSIRSGYTMDDVEDRRFRLSTRRAATDHVAPEPTVLMFGASWIPTVNDRWVADSEYGMYRQKEGHLYVSERILDETKLRRLLDEGFRLVVWRGAKWEYVRGDIESWEQYVEIVDDLESFFGAPIEGRWKSER